MCASDEVGKPLLVVRLEVGCKNFGCQDWDRDSVKSFGDLYWRVELVCCCCGLLKFSERHLSGQLRSNAVI